MCNVSRQRESREQVPLDFWKTTVGRIVVSIENQFQTGLALMGER
jgi:hypothetical protein